MNDQNYQTSHPSDSSYTANDVFADPRNLKWIAEFSTWLDEQLFSMEQSFVDFATPDSVRLLSDNRGDSQ